MESSNEQHLTEIEIVCNIINVFTMEAHFHNGIILQKKKNT